MTQRRLPKHRRSPESVARKQITERSLAIVELVNRYRFIRTSDIVRLVAGNADVTHRHLQHLYHRGLISRLISPTQRNKEFVYFLDNAAALRELSVTYPVLSQYELNWEQIRLNREKYSAQNLGAQEDIGRLLFVNHELMISAFHADVERSCTNSDIELERWEQGAALWSSIEHPDVRETIPHRPDAFFTLRVSSAPEGQQRSNFFFEADRNSTNLTRMRTKLESHLSFLMARKHTERYGIRRVRAVLIQSTDQNRTANLKNLAGLVAAEQPLAAVLFWFSTANIESSQSRISVSSPIWATTGDEKLRSLLD